MPDKKKVARDDTATRKKRLVLYGLAVVVAIAFVLSLIITWLVLMPLGGEHIGKVILYTALTTVATAVLCVIVWFLYTKLLLRG